MISGILGSSPRKRLVNNLQFTRPDTASLQELRAELVSSATEFPEPLLWAILKKSEEALKHVSDEQDVALIKEIRRSANWEIQSRHRAT